MTDVTLRPPFCRERELRNSAGVVDSRGNVMMIDRHAIKIL